MQFIRYHLNLPDPGGLVRCLTVILTFFMTSHARAQSLAGDAGPFYRPILSAHVQRFNRIANLDAEQKASVNLLYKGYRDAFKQAEKKITEDIEKQRNQSGQSPRDGNDREKRMQLIWKFVEETKALEETFLDDFGAILRPDQSEKMKSVRFARTRDYGLRFAALAGDAVDLVVLCDDLGIARDGEVAQALDEYEMQIHRQIEVKQQIFHTFFKISMKEDQPDPEKIKELFSKFIEQSVRMRDINRQSSRLIASLLPEDKKNDWEREFKARSYPTVSRKLAADEALTDAKKLNALSDAQREQVLELDAKYQRNLDAVNRRWIAAIDTWQNRLATDGLDIIGKVISAGEDDPLSKVRKDRVELDEKTLAELKLILTKEQQKQLALDEKSSITISDGLNDVVPFVDDDDAAEEEWSTDADSDED